MHRSINCITGVLGLGLAFCVILECGANSQADNGHFANHRVLSFHRIGKYGGERTLLIDGARVIFQDQAGVVWVGTSSGLYSYNEQRDQWADFREQLAESFRYVMRISQDNAGRIWLKSLLSEFRFFDGKQWRSASELQPPVPLPTTKNSIMITGNHRTLWFVTPSGLTYFDGQKWIPPILPPLEIEQAYSRTLISQRNKKEGKKEPWSERTGEEGLAEMISDSHSDTVDDQLKPTSVLLSSMFRGLQDRNGNIWLGGIGGIIRIHPNNWQWRLHPLHGIVEVKLIYEDRRGTIWFADREGHLSAYSAQTDAWKSYDLAVYFPQIQPQAIESIYQDKVGNVMIGTSDAGLLLYNEKENKWSPNRDHIDPPVDGVFSIVEDQIGRIWIGTNRGILVLEQ